jgi:hypothetical protein
MQSVNGHWYPDVPYQRGFGRGYDGASAAKGLWISHRDTHHVHCVDNMGRRHGHNKLPYDEFTEPRADAQKR